MKMYVVRGEHWSTPGQPTSAHFDASAAHEAAGTLVNALGADAADFRGDWKALPEGVSILPNAWQGALRELQARRAVWQVDPVAVEPGNEDSEWIDKILRSFSDDDLASEAGFSVWIEMHDTPAIFDDRELATVLGSLRAVQNIQQHEALAPEITDIMTDGGRFAALDHGEVDALCERLNDRSAPDHIQPAADSNAANGPYRPELAEAFRQGARELQLDCLDIRAGALVEEGEGGAYVHCRVYVRDSQRLPMPGEDEEASR